MVKYLVADLTALQIARLSGLNRSTVNHYLRLIRERIAAYGEQESLFSSTVEMDESYFGARRMQGKRGRGACGSRVQFARKPRCKPLSRVKLTQKASSIQTVGRAITAWLKSDTVTSAWITARTNSPNTMARTSTESKGFGALPKSA